MSQFAPVIHFALAVVPFVVFAGCETSNSEDDPIDATWDGALPDGELADVLSPDVSTGGPCRSSEDCASTADAPVCDLTENGGTCVRCTTADHSLCAGTTPVCENHTCVACASDNDCATDSLCLPTGACAEPASIVHAVSTDGSQDIACGTDSVPCTLDTALFLISATKNVIKLDDTGPYILDDEAVVTKNVTIVARGATIQRANAGGPILTVTRGPTSTGPTVTILGVDFQDCEGDSGIQCSDSTLELIGTSLIGNGHSGIRSSSCEISISKAGIAGNGIDSDVAAISVNGGSISLSQSEIVLNRGATLSITGDARFAIIGNLFRDNGGLGASSANRDVIYINTTTTPSDRFEFNTVASNHSTTSHAPGMRCTDSRFTARNNIIWGNSNGTPKFQVDGDCKHAFSDIEQTLSAAIDGHDNLNTDPIFQSPFSSDYSLKADSPLRAKADPVADLTGVASVDLGGQLRVAPADIGAYQVPQQ